MKSLNVFPSWHSSLGELSDACQRRIGYLRLSLTPACPMRCSYCRPAVLEDDGAAATMSPAMIEAMVRHLIDRWGLSKVRLTGGEPTVRRDLLEIIARLAGLPGLRDLAMTTNGLTLMRHASDYRQAGLMRLNVSLDSLRPQTFAQMTGVTGLDRVLDGIRAARNAGFETMKLNTVVIAGQNDDELCELTRFAAAEQLEIRFIELMPMGPLADQWSHRFVSEDVMRQRLMGIADVWEPVPQGHDSARRYRLQLAGGHAVTVGFITPMSCNFCAACNRIRITANGDVYPCLMDRPRANILDALRPEFEPRRLDALLQESLREKAPVHPAHGFTTMTLLGG